MSKRESQNKRLLKWLISGNAIMPRMAQLKLGIDRLAARIKDLRYKGIIIKDQMEYHWPVKFKRYWIDKKVCKAYQKAQS